MEQKEHRKAVRIRGGKPARTRRVRTRLGSAGHIVKGASLPGGAHGVRGGAGGRPELDLRPMEERECEEAGDVARAWGAPSLQGRRWREPQILPFGCSGAGGRDSEDSLRPSAARPRNLDSGTREVSASSLVKGASETVV